jgi:hypothetical protein
VLTQDFQFSEFWPDHEQSGSEPANCRQSQLISR